jgi:hypothetical protein
MSAHPSGDQMVEEMSPPYDLQVEKHRIAPQQIADC